MTPTEAKAVDLKQSRSPTKDDAHREYMEFAADLGALYRLNARRLRIGYDAPPSAPSKGEQVEPMPISDRPAPTTRMTDGRQHALPGMGTSLRPSG